MSNPVDLQPGQTIGFATKPVGLKTSLYVTAGDGECTLIWTIVLCCKPDNSVELRAEEPKTVDISEAAGALVNVRNGGFHPFKVWTDY